MPTRATAETATPPGPQSRARLLDADGSRLGVKTASGGFGWLGSDLRIKDPKVRVSFRAWDGYFDLAGFPVPLEVRNSQPSGSSSRAWRLMARLLPTCLA